MVTQARERNKKGLFRRKQHGGNGKADQGAGPGASSRVTGRRRSEDAETHTVPDAKGGAQTRRLPRRASESDKGDGEEAPRDEVQAEEPDDRIRVIRRRSESAGDEEKKGKKGKEESSVAHVVGGGQEAVGRGRRRPLQAESTAATAKDAPPLKRSRLLEELALWPQRVRGDERQVDVVVEKDAQADAPGERRLSHRRRVSESLEEKGPAVLVVQSKTPIPHSPVTPNGERSRKKNGPPRDHPMLGYVGLIVSVPFLRIHVLLFVY